MSDNNQIFYPLDYTHEELSLMLKRLKNGYLLSEEDYKLLQKKGLGNLSTFSGSYNDLKDKPDLSYEIKNVLSLDNIETTNSVQEKLQNIIKTFNANCNEISQGLRKEMALLEIEIYEYLQESINDMSVDIKKTVDDWCIALSIDLQNLMKQELENRFETVDEKILNCEKLINSNKKEIDDQFQIIFKAIDTPPIYESPVLTLSTSNKAIHNVSSGIIITPKFTQNDAGEIISYTLKRDDVVIFESSSVQAFKDTIQISHGSIVRYSAIVEYGDGAIKESVLGNPYPTGKIKAGSIATTMIVSCYAYSYYGVIDSEIDIQTLENVLNTSRGYTTVYQLNNQRSVYMYPSTFGELTSIKDANGFEYKDSYSFSQMTIDGISYNIYKLADPVTIVDFKQIFA